MFPIKQNLIDVKTKSEAILSQHRIRVIKVIRRRDNIQFKCSPRLYKKISIKSQSNCNKTNNDIDIYIKSSFTTFYWQLSLNGVTDFTDKRDIRYLYVVRVILYTDTYLKWRYYPLIKIQIEIKRI